MLKSTGGFQCPRMTINYYENKEGFKERTKERREKEKGGLEITQFPTSRPIVDSSLACRHINMGN
jgi:hypothetical protein